MINPTNPKSRDKELVVQNLNDEVLIYDQIINKAYTLNETSSFIWRLCDGRNSVREIAERLSKHTKTEVGEEIVWLALDGFRKNDLLAGGETLGIEFDGLSRRQVIKKVGFASMIALPIISALIAPTAAMAQSGCPSGDGPDDPNGNTGNGDFCTCNSGGDPRVRPCNTSRGGDGSFGGCRAGCLCRSSAVNQGFVAGTCS